jgi:hypothetical protein
MELAMVLLPEDVPPLDATDILDAYRQIGGDGAALADVGGADECASSEGPPPLHIRLAGDDVFVMRMPVPVPNGEAEDAARFSVSSFSSAGPLPPHTSHLIVTMLGEARPLDVERKRRFTQLLAAILTSTKAIAVYSGAAGATHPADFFVDIARDVELPLLLWTGVSLAGDETRLSLLSLGMAQFDLPDLLLETPRAMGTDALGFFFDILEYVLTRGAAIPDGETVGRTSGERLPVRYVPSPIDPEKQVFRVAIPLDEKPLN